MVYDIEIFCNLDGFMKELETILTKNSISNSSQTKRRNRKSEMNKSEVMTIMVIFHLKSYRNQRYFYLYYVCKHMNDFFSDPVSYNRFVGTTKESYSTLSSVFETPSIR